jgi:RimJ/RimL family protein N-acetyltransferase
MTEAIKLNSNFVFTHLQAIEIHADVFAGNLASSRVLENNGFHLDGVLEKHHVKQGKLVDALHMVLEREDWIR